MWLFDVVWGCTVFLVTRALVARLLAVRIGPVAAAVAGGLGIGAGLGLQRALAQGSSSGAATYATFAAFSLLTTMAVVATLGLLARPAARAPFATGSPVPHPLRALQMRIGRTRRYLSLTWLGARYGLGPLSGIRRPHSDQELGAALRDALQEAGGIFVKFGQLLGACRSRAGGDRARALQPAGRRDTAAGNRHARRDRPGARTPRRRPVRRVRAEAAGGSVDRAGAPRPPAQRRAGRGQGAAPGDRAAGRARSRHPASSGTHGRGARRLGAPDRLGRARRGLRRKSPAGTRLPHRGPEHRVHRCPQRSAADAARPRRAVHTARPCRGVGGRSDAAAGASSARAAGAHAFGTEAVRGHPRRDLRAGVFHAEPHPGNVLVDSTGRIVLLDFGSVGRLDRLQQPALAQALAAIARRRPTLLRDALIDLSTTDDAVDLDGLERTLARFLAQRLGPGIEPGADILNDLLGVVVRHGLALDAQLAGVFRALATLEGTLRLIDPSFSVVEEARRYAQARKLGLPRPAQLRDEVLEDVLELLPTLRKIPRRLDHITGALERGELSVRIRPFAHPRDAGLVVRLTNRLILAFFSASIGLVSVFLLRLHDGPRMFGSHLDVLLGYGGLIAATVLGLRVIVAVTREGG